MDSYLWTLIWFLMLLFILIPKLFQIWPVATLSSWVLCLFYKFPSNFLAFQQSLIWTIVFSLTSLESVIFPRILASFPWKMVHRETDLATTCTHSFGVLLLLSVQWTCVYPWVWIYTLLWSISKYSIKASCGHRWRFLEVARSGVCVGLKMRWWNWFVIWS